MITKLHIDALIASKADLYRSVEHFRQLDHEQLLKSIRQEIESLAELADPEICLKRCQFFDLPGVNQEEYEEKILYIDDDSFILAGIRFQGLDVTKPFVSILGNFKKADSIPFNKIAQIVREKFKAFKPHSFHMSFPEGITIPANYKIDRYTVMGNIQNVVNLPLDNISDQVELMPLKEMNFYEDYVREYEKIFSKYPQLKNEVDIESLDSLNDAGNENLLFEILINGQRAGVIAGYTENYFG